MKTLETTLIEHPLLEDLSAPHRKLLFDCSMRAEFKAGELIFREGDMANRFYLIESGAVSLETMGEEKPYRIQLVEAGGVLGWSWLFPPYYWHFDAIALEPTKAIFFYGTRLREECERDHDLGYELMKRMSQIVIKRLQATQRKLIALEEPSQNARKCREKVDFA